MVVRKNQNVMEIFSGFKKALPLIILFAIASLLLIPSLEKYPFWQDEAETALLAKSILKNGLPYVWDGKNIITQFNGNESTPDGLWTLTPWLPFYITAASFKIFGESNFSGRLPFVIIALLSIIPCYILALRLTKSDKAAFLSSLFLIVNMQFILYSRQCKYYSISFLLSSVIVLLYQEMGNSWKKTFWFIISAVLLFYTNYVALFNIFCGLWIYAVFISKDAHTIKRFLLSSAIIAGAAFPFFLLASASAAASEAVSLPTLKAYADKLVRHMWYFNNMALPLIIFIPLLKIRRFKPAIEYLMCIIITAWAALPLLNQDTFRYNLGLIPLCSILLAITTAAAWEKKRLFGMAAAILLLTTNILSYFPWTISKIFIKTSGFKFSGVATQISEQFKKDPVKTETFFNQMDDEIANLSALSVLTHDILKIEYAAYYNHIFNQYNEPITAIIGHLNKEAGPDDVVVTNFGQLSLEYYANFKIGNLIDKKLLKTKKTFEMGDHIFDLSKANWVIYRQTSLPKGPFVNDKILKDNNLDYEIYDTKINEIYWDGAHPLYFAKFKDKFFFQKETPDKSIKIYKLNSSK
jgi:hypothetical protein